MKVACDLCHNLFEDNLLQILERGNEILYVCPECYTHAVGEPPEEQA